MVLLISAAIVTLATSGSKRYVTVEHPSECPSVPSFFQLNRAPGDFFLTLMEHAAHTQRDSPGDSTRRVQRTFPFENDEDTYLFIRYR